MKRLLLIAAQVIGVAIVWVLCLSMFASIAIAVWHGFNPSGYPDFRQH